MMKLCSEVIISSTTLYNLVLRILGLSRYSDYFAKTRQADARLAASSGFAFAPNASEHDYTFSIEPVSGYALSVPLC